MHRLLLLLTAGTLGLCYARADQIHLTNGQVLDGLVTEEGEEWVTFTVGAGTMRLPRDRVARIERAEGEKREAMERSFQARNLLHPDHVPGGFEALYEGYRDIRKRSKSARQAYRSFPKLTKEKAALYAGLAGAEKSLLRKRQGLERFDVAANPAAYNVEVNRFNEYAAEVARRRERFLAVDESLTRHGGTLHEFAAACSALRSLVREARQLSGPLPEDGDRVLFLEALDHQLDEWLDLFPETDVAVEMAGNGHRIVAVTINDSDEPFRLMVDTGASAVVLSEQVASRLGIEAGPDSARKVTLANGQVVKGYEVRLASLTVAGETVHGVQAVVLPQPPSQYYHGLLGMSFLKHFMITLQPEGGLGLRRIFPDQ